MTRIIKIEIDSKVQAHCAMDHLNSAIQGNEKLSKSEFMAYMAMLANDFYEGHDECEGALDARVLLECFRDNMDAFIDLTQP